MYRILFLFAFLIPSLAEAKCTRTGKWERFHANQTTPRWFDVEKDTDCIYETRYPNANLFVSAKVSIPPKSGQGGVNSERILFVPKKGFVGKDYMQVKVVLKNQGIATLDIHYTVK